MAESRILLAELGGARRVLELVGAGLPFQGANWGRAQRVITTWFPGNGADASQQVLGPIELPSEWNGEWSTTMLVVEPCKLDGGNITRASTLRDVMEELCAAGQLLRVTWVQETAGLARRVVREGRLVEVDFTHARADDIGWKASFEWTGRGQRVQRVVAFRTDSTSAQVEAQAKALDDLVAKIDNASIASKDGVPGAADSFSLGDLEAMADYPNQLMKQVSQFGKQLANRARHIGDLIRKVRGLPSELAGQLVDVATNAIAVANQFVDAMGQPAPEALALDGKVSRMLQAASYYGDAQTAAGLVVDAAVKLRESAIARRRAAENPGQRGTASGEGDVIAVHVVREGDVLQSISQTYYGTTALAPAIARANGLAGYAVQVDVGTILVIPTIKNAKTMLG